MLKIKLWNRVEKYVAKFLLDKGQLTAGKLDMIKVGKKLQRINWNPSPKVL